MSELKTLRISATIDEDDESKRAFFHQFWHAMRTYSLVFQELIEAIPKSVELKAGLTRQEKVLGDYAGWYSVKGCVLRKILETYKGLQGTYLQAVDLDILKLSGEYDVVIDGDGNDSDEEIEG
jgi:hypothetical protein